MFHWISSAILGTVLLAVTACAPLSPSPISLPPPVPVPRVGGTLELGRSTKQDVYAQFGQPSNVRYTKASARWIYLTVNPATAIAVVFPVAGTVTGDNMMETHALVFHFAGGLLRRHVATHHSYDRTTWSGLQRDMRQAPQVEEFQVRQEMAKLGLVFDPTVWDVTCTTMSLWPTSTPVAPSTEGQ